MASMEAVLSIAGSDSSGGAGIQADIKTIAALGLFAETAVTALTAQNTTGVFGVLDVDPAFVAQQIDVVFEDIRPAAVKVGMVSSAAIVEAIAEALTRNHAENVVVDPVMVATSGAKLISVDPRVNWLATRAEVHLRVRPGTDTALAMAWIYVMAKEDLVDHDFIDKWCYGYDELVQRVQEMPPSRAAVICGVPEEQIWRAARLYGKAKPSSLAWGLAVDENPNGTQLGQCLIALMTITGFIDAPGGTTLGMGDDQGNVVRDGGAIDSSEKVDDETDSTLMLALKHGIMTQETWDTKRIGIDKYPAVGSVMWTAHPDEFLKALETEEPFKIHMAQFVSSNPVGTAIAAEPQRWYKALKKLDFNFACDLFMNPTIMACCDVQGLCWIFSSSSAASWALICSCSTRRETSLTCAIRPRLVPRLLMRRTRVLPSTSIKMDVGNAVMLAWASPRPAAMRRTVSSTR